MDKSYEYRRDDRSDKAYASNIGDFTERETYWGIALRYDFVARGMMCEVIENGVDNTGKIIRGKLVNHNVDKKFVFKTGTRPIEIKTIPEGCKGYMTFKVWALNICLEQRATLIVPRLNCYYIFTEPAIRRMLEELPHQIYYKFCPRKSAVRAFNNHLNIYQRDGIVVKKVWMEKAAEFIKDNEYLLTREKYVDDFSN